MAINRRGAHKVSGGVSVCVCVCVCVDEVLHLKNENMWGSFLFPVSANMLLLNQALQINNKKTFSITASLLIDIYLQHNMKNVKNSLSVFSALSCACGLSFRLQVQPPPVRREGSSLRGTTRGKDSPHIIPLFIKINCC